MDKFQKLTKALKGKNSIFVKTFVGLILLSLAMIFFFGFWMSQVTAQNHRRQVAQTNLSRLHQAGEAMDLTVEVLSQNMAQIMWSNDFITYLVTPQNVNQDRDYRMIQQLKNSVSRSTLIQKAYLYSPISDMIYDSNAIYRAKDYLDWKIIEDHYQEPPVSAAMKDAMTVTKVVSHSGRLLLIQDLNVASRIGTLVFELNIWALNDALGLKNTDSEPEIFVYDEAGNQIFKNLLSYDGIEPDLDAEEEFIYAADINRAEEKTSGYYRFDSKERNWIYLMPLDQAVLSVGLKDFLPIYLPTSIILMIISVCFAFYISHSVYKPINRLMKMVTQTGDKDREGSTEIDFLEDVYSDALGKQSQMKGLIANIAPEILDSMLTNLLVGKRLTEQRVTEILEGVGDPIHVHDRYLVSLCQLTEPKDREVNDAELNLHLLSIKNLLSGIDTGSYRIYDLHTDKMIVAVVMAFPESYTATAMKKEYTQISQLLLRLGEKIPYGIRMERGSIYQNIMDIRYAYQEALEKLKYQQYLESGDDTASDENHSEEDRMINRRYFRERIKSITEQIGLDDKNGAEVLIQRILEDLRRDEPDFDGFCSAVNNFLDELVEKVISLPLSAEDQKSLELTRISDDIAKKTDAEEVICLVMDYSRNMIRILHAHSGKSSYKYVEKAKEYIAQHYSDSNLSLNDIGVHIGISGSYLSELFNEISGEKFSSYLAAYRVEKAKQLLRTTNVTIKEIGFLCGFNSIQNFIRVFKKYTDQTPGHYRGEQ